MMQTKPWDFMVKLTPQREWIEGHGIMVAFAMFFGGISGGLYLSALYFHSLLGMFIAWLFAAAARLTDMAHLATRCASGACCASLIAPGFPAALS